MPGQRGDTVWVVVGGMAIVAVTAGLTLLFIWTLDSRDEEGGDGEEEDRP